MKAVLLERYGSPYELFCRDVPVRPPDANEIVVLTAAAAVNPADWKLCEGQLQKFLPITLPAVPGIDVSGRVIAVGDKVSAFQVGDPVIAALPLKGRGTYAEQVTASARFFTGIPGSLDIVDAAAIPTAGLTGLQLIERGIQVKPGQRVLVTGATGAVGHVALFVAKQLGAYVIAGVRARYLNAARELGADEILVLDDPAAIARLAQVDAIADTVGGGTTNALVNTVKPGGILSTVATDPITAKPTNPVTFHRTIFVPDADDLARLVHMVEAGKLSFPIARRMPLADAKVAHQLLKQGGLNGKILLLAGQPD